MSEISLNELLIPEKVVEIDFPGFSGLKFQLCFLSRNELTKLRKKCVNTVFDRRTKQPEERLDEDKFLEEYSKAIIKGWSGFKLEYVEKLLLVDVSTQDPQAEMAYTPDNAKVLLEQSTIFDDWITEVVADLENFTSNS